MENKEISRKIINLRKQFKRNLSSGKEYHTLDYAVGYFNAIKDIRKALNLRGERFKCKELFKIRLLDLNSTIDATSKHNIKIDRQFEKEYEQYILGNQR